MSVYLAAILLSSFTLMLSRAFTDFTVGICLGALIAYMYYRKERLGRFISLGSLGWMVGFLLAMAHRGKDGHAFPAFCRLSSILFPAGANAKRY